MSDNGEKYQANRNDNEASDSSKKAAKVAAKAAADYFTGGKGGAVVDKLADTKLGNKVLNTAGKALEKQPGFAKAAKKLDDAGALDAADKGLSMVEGAGTGGAANAEKAATKTPNSDSPSSLSDNTSKGGNSSFPKFGDFFGKKGGKKSKIDEQLEGENDEDGEGEISSGFTGEATGDSSLIKKIWGMLDPITKIYIILGLFFFSIIMLGFLIILINLSGKSGSSTSSIVGTGSCNYKINGFSAGSGKNYNREVNMSNLKVRLMNCSGGSPVEGEELVDFEKYILGVVYQENGGGSDEGIKAEAVAARSFALARPAVMGNAAGLKLEEENGQWILQIRACTYDQAYCDPDKGCYSGTSGGEYGGTMHSGQSSSAGWSKPPMPADSKIRSLVESTKGQVVVNSDNYVIHTTYNSTIQETWNASSLDYKQMLIQQYGNMGAADILQMECSSASYDSSGDEETDEDDDDEDDDDEGEVSATTGPYTTWKQYDSAWASVPIGNSGKTIQNIGCTVTSVSMLVAKSGVNVTIDDFNPGTLVKALNNNGGFTPGGALNWAVVTKFAPNFIYGGQAQTLTDLSKEEKLSKLKSLIDKGYYVIAEVKGKTGQHWVAVDNINGDKINMFDPGSSSTDMWGQYNWQNTSTYAFYYVS